MILTTDILSQWKRILELANFSLHSRKHGQSYGKQFQIGYIIVLPPYPMFHCTNLHCSSHQTNWFAALVYSSITSDDSHSFSRLMREPLQLCKQVTHISPSFLVPAQSSIFCDLWVMRLVNATKHCKKACVPLWAHVRKCKYPNKLRNCFKVTLFLTKVDFSLFKAAFTYSGGT